METILHELARYLQDRLIYSTGVEAEMLVAFVRSIAGNHPAADVISEAKHRGWIRGPWYDCDPDELESAEMHGDDWRVPKRFGIMPAVEFAELAAEPEKATASPTKAKVGRKRIPQEEDAALLAEYELSGLSLKEFSELKKSRHLDGYSVGNLSERLTRARKHRDSENRSENPAG